MKRYKILELTARKLHSMEKDSLTPLEMTQIAAKEVAAVGYRLVLAR